MRTITVGEILKAQGIAGEIKVKPLTADVRRFEKLRVVYIDGKPNKILGLRIERGYAYLKSQGVDTRNAAELLRGKLLEIDRVNAVDLEDGEYFIADLIGCNVVADGIRLGTITDVLQNSGTADIINAMGTNGKEFRFPFLNRIVCFADVAQKIFAVDKKLLDEVCVYDD